MEEEENSSPFFQFSRARLTRAFVDVFEKERKKNNKTSVYRLGRTGRLCPKGMPFFRFQVFERVGVSPLKYMKKKGNLS